MRGDEEKNRWNNATAISMYKKALVTAEPTQVRYIIPRVLACYRRCNTPTLARQFFVDMKNAYGQEIMDRVSYTVMAAAFGDMNDWDEALNYANQACRLNDGIIDEFLEAVYNRIDSNRNRRIA